MSIRTPRWLERRWGRRASLHFFQWGFHAKLRTGERWRHFVVKVNRMAVFGEKDARRMVWVGWWESRRGTRKHLNGFRFVVALDRLPEYPRATTRIPFFPQPGQRDRRRV